MLLQRSPERRGGGQSFIKAIGGKRWSLPSSVLLPGCHPAARERTLHLTLISTDFSCCLQSSCRAHEDVSFRISLPPVSFSSKPSPWIFMSWIKPPSSLRLPAQRLGKLLPNLLATKAKKTLQNTDDQKQSAVMLPFPCICSLAAC